MCGDTGKLDRSVQQQHSLLSQASWGRLEMKPKRNNDPANFLWVSNPLEW